MSQPRTRKALTAKGITRRSMLAGTAGVGGAALLVPTRSSAHGLPAGARPSPRPIAFHRFERPADFARGHHQGTHPSGQGLRLAPSAHTARAYVDPLGDGSTVTYDSGSWTSPVLHHPFALTELIASWNVDTPSGTWVEVQARGVADGKTRTGWFVLGRWCSRDPEQGGAIHRTSVDDQGTDLATVYTDTLAARDGHALNDIELQVNLMRPRGSHLTPTVRMLGAVSSALPDDATVPVSTPGPGRGIELSVPTYSQEIHVGQYPQWDNGGEAWCSPTSSTMIINSWGRGPSKRDLSWVEPMTDPQVAFGARNTFDYTYDGCGNWPFNTAYAATFGLSSFVTRLRSLREAESFIAAGIPLALSVSFKKGELDGAGYGTNGHLMVLRGFDRDGNPIMNDPASHLIASDQEVRVVYPRAQLENAWVPHSGGTVYVMHPAGTRLPRRAADSAW